jgi:hypothetical protein
MIHEVAVDTVYISPSGKQFKVLHLARHGQNCLYPMVVYTNLDTTDYPPGQIWVIEESIFLKTFRDA